MESISAKKIRNRKDLGPLGMNLWTIISMLRFGDDYRGNAGPVYLIYSAVSMNHSIRLNSEMQRPTYLVNSDGMHCNSNMPQVLST